MKDNFTAPGFPGFYNGIYENVWPEYYQTIGKEYIDKLNETFMRKYNIECMYCDVSCPQYYNYKTDEIVCYADLDYSDFDRLIDDSSLQDFVAEQNKIPGFYSFCPGNKEGFMAELSNSNSIKPMIGYLYEYLLWKENKQLPESINKDIFYGLIDNNPLALDNSFWELNDDMETAELSEKRHELIENVSDMLGLKSYHFDVTNVYWDIDYDENGVLPIEFRVQLVDIPSDVLEGCLKDKWVLIDYVSDFLSDQTAYCHQGFCTNIDRKLENIDTVDKTSIEKSIQTNMSKSATKKISNPEK